MPSHFIMDILHREHHERALADLFIVGIALIALVTIASL